MSAMKSRTEKVNKNLTFSSDIDEAIILFERSTIELISFAQFLLWIVSILIYSAAEKKTADRHADVKSFTFLVYLCNCQRCYCLFFDIKISRKWNTFQREINLSIYEFAKKLTPQIMQTVLSSFPRNVIWIRNICEYWRSKTTGSIYSNDFTIFIIN